MQEHEDQFMDAYCLAPSPMDKLGGVWPIRAGRNIAKPSYRTGPKQIDCFSIHYVVRGKVELTFGEETEIVEAGGMFGLFPSVTYYYRTASTDDPLQMRWVAFQGPQAAVLMQEIGLAQERPFRRDVLDPSLLQTLDLILAGSSRAESDPSVQTTVGLELTGLLYRMFGRLAEDRQGKQSKHGSQGNRPDGEDASRDWVLQCKEYMDIHYTENISVESVASRAGVHRSYLTVQFTKKVGMPPLRYIQKLRMARAAGMLEEAGAHRMTVSEIAYSLGYPDLSTFTRAFHSYYGCSPTRYRSGD